jgi:LacI family gluconate utilization system Gnt-I transcriptional repressor
VARHLAAQGRQRLAFIGGDDPRATRRWCGFRDAAADAGLPEPARLILDRNASAGAAALARLPTVDAVFAANDAHAIGLLAGLRQAGVSAGRTQSVAVVGLGDLEMGQMIVPSLSTIRVYGAAIGQAAAGLTLDRSGPRRIDLGFELVLRDSG